jgi:hypothetical protein
MSLSTPAYRPGRSLRHRLTILASAAALSIAGLAMATGPAHADAVVQITDSADPVPVNTSYTYAVNIPSTDSGQNFNLDVDLTGAAATFTGASVTGFGLFCGAPSGAHIGCSSAVPHVPDFVVTLTVLPTAAGTVTANAVVSGIPSGSDTAATTITGSTFPFTGFYAPVDNPPTVNSMKAGAAVPVKFSLGGDEGLNIFNPGYPASQNVTCDTGAPIDPIEQTVTAGNSSLTYDSATDRYTYVWKTDKAWKNTCRTLILQLTDGTNHTANFTFH